MKMSAIKQKNLYSNQEGFASIVIAIVLILVLSLLTVGFVQLMNKETRSALDKQLASQAYYAAESGINDAAEAISTNPIVSKDRCEPNSTFDGKVGNDEGVTYSCLLINPTPSSLDYTVDTGQTKVTQLQGVDAAGTPKAVGSMQISWQDKGGSTNFVPANRNCNGSSTNTFYPASGPSAWPYSGLLRFQLIPIVDLSRNGLTTNAFTAFLCPEAGSGSPTTAPYSDNKGLSGGGVISGGCNTSGSPRHCNVKITGLSTLNQSTFFLAMRSIYSSNNVTIKIYGADINNSPLNIALAQILVDSTGKAQDVLKRIQVRIPAHNGYAIPDNTAAMNSICKQLQITPDGGSRGGGISCDPFR